MSASLGCLPGIRCWIGLGFSVGGGFRQAYFVSALGWAGLVLENLGWKGSGIGLGW